MISRKPSGSRPLVAFAVCTGARRAGLGGAGGVSQDIPMTEHPKAAFPPVETEQERQNSCRHTIRRLIIAQAAMRLALQAAREALREASGLEQRPDQILAGWQAANALVDPVFGRFDLEVSNALTDLRHMLAPR
jgi:hypothetical protein